jgi:hypothetical protein
MGVAPQGIATTQHHVARLLNATQSKDPAGLAGFVVLARR